MDNRLEKQNPFGQYEWVDVAFTVADQDVVIPYTRLRPNDPNTVRWLDVTQQATISGEVPRIYRATTGTARVFGAGFVVLRCTHGHYATRLLLFVERNEG